MDSVLFVVFTLFIYYVAYRAVRHDELLPLYRKKRYAGPGESGGVESAD